MRGGFLHNQVLIGSLRREAQRHGAIINDEVRVTTDDGATGFIDLVITAGPRRIAIEAERSTHRVRWDLAKADGTDADELWIVVAHVGIARAARRLIVRCPPCGIRPKVFVLTQGQALRRLTAILALFSMLNPSLENNSSDYQTGSNS